MEVHDKFLDILIYIGNHIDKNILIKCASILINKKLQEHQEHQETDLQEIQGDLFTTSDKSSSLAHCLAKDLGMGKGIALFFKKKYGGLDELKDQNLQIGDVGVLKRNDRYVYHLITKNRSSGYPKLDDLKMSLIDMKKHALKHNVKMISMPRIGTGLDKLNWSDVKQIIMDVFANTGIKIRIYWI